MLWETPLCHRARRPASDSPAHSTDLGGRGGSRLGSGPVGLGYSIPEGRGTGRHTWCLRSKVQRRGPACRSPAGPRLGWETVAAGALPHGLSRKVLPSVAGAPSSPTAPTGLPRLCGWGPGVHKSTDYAGLVFPVVNHTEGRGPPGFVTNYNLKSLFFSQRGYIMDWKIRLS